MISTEDDRIPEDRIERSPVDYDNPFFVDDYREIGILNVHAQIWRYTRWLPAICDRLYLIILHDAQEPKRPRSVKELADAAGVTRDTITEATRALEYVNMIRVVRDENRHAMQKEHNRYQALPAHQWKMLDRKYAPKENPASIESKPDHLRRSRKSISEDRQNRRKNNTIQDSQSPFTTFKDSVRNAPSELPTSVPMDAFGPVEGSPEIPVTMEKANTPGTTLPLLPARTLAVPTVQTPAPFTEKDQPVFRPMPGMLVWYQPTREKTGPRIPALVLRVRKQDAVIVYMSHGKIVDWNAAFSRMKERAGADEYDPALQAYAKERLIASQEHAYRAELMDAWKKSTEGVYGATGFQVGPLLRAKGSIFEQLAQLKLTPVQVECAGQLYKAWWEMQRPITKPDVGSMVIAIRLAVNLCDRKYTPENIRSVMNKLMLEPFWKEKVIPFSHVATQTPILIPAPGNSPDKPKAKLNESDIAYAVFLKNELLNLQDGQASSYTRDHADEYRRDLRDMIVRGYQLTGRIPKEFADANR